MSKIRTGLSTVPKPQPPPQVDSEIIALNYVFFDPTMSQNNTTTPYSIELSATKFNNRLQSTRSEFLKCLLEYNSFKTAEKHLEFYKPTQLTALEDVEHWPEKGVLPTFDTVTSMFDINETHFEPVFLTKSLAKSLGDSISNDDLLHLIVAATNGHLAGEESDVLGPLAADAPGGPPQVRRPQVIRYLSALGNVCLTPSASWSKAYQDNQAEPATAIFDGRQSRLPTAINTTAPPLHLFHPIFERFVRLANRPDFKPESQELSNVQALMDFVSFIYDNEAVFAAGLQVRLCSILGADIKVMQNFDGTIVDGIWPVDIEGVSYPVVLIEFKKELGEGLCDPTTQAGLISRRTWSQLDRRGIVNQTCCPTFLIAGGGSWFTICGMVFTDRFIVQRLTGMLPAWSASTDVYDVAIALARVFRALRDCGKKLEEEYTALGPQVEDYKGDEFIDSRFFPYFNAFTQDEKIVEFEYIQALDSDASCVTFLAKIPSQDDKEVVVKFVEQYGEVVHRFLAERDYAPKLHYCGPPVSTHEPKNQLLMDLPSRVPVTTETVAGVPRGNWSMVVMDYIPSSPGSSGSGQYWPSNAKAQLAAVLTELHLHGYVIGDLRRPNVLFSAKQKVKLIDFDWCGRFDPSVEGTFKANKVPQDVQAGIKRLPKEDLPQESYAHYPLGLSKGINWGGGKELNPIRPEHDWVMLDML